MLANLCVGPLTMTGRLQGFGLLMVYMAAFLMQWNYSLDIGSMQVIHSFLDFEEKVMSKLPQVPISMATKVMKVFVLTVEVGVVAYPILQFFLLRLLPCMPPYILSMFPGCVKCDPTLLHRVVKLCLHIFEAWMSLNTIISGTTWMFYVLFVGIVCILDYFRVLESKISEIENDSNKDDCIHLYRCIQILEKSFNAFLMPRIVPATMFCVPAIEILAFYVCISFHADISMPAFLIFPVMAVCAGMNNILVITLASRVNVASQKMKIAVQKRTVGRCRRALAKRQIRACNVLKIKFGSNFIDEGTPLVMQNFCINQTMSLALVKRRKVIS
ncbi:hypothetical protein Fcan01_00593 [Folsomia candida]|uniref:Uncharacterized protein n=1 Tax=Folsomia candida TaxID=158441 RepID=A0A226F3M4_FOLCA|nr:hypothetical protein Fcan01_00593 [Folsomia candida]